jgi:hypothetical protein
MERLHEERSAFLQNESIVPVVEPDRVLMRIAQAKEKLWGWLEPNNPAFWKNVLREGPVFIRCFLRDRLGAEAKELEAIHDVMQLLTEVPHFDASVEQVDLRKTAENWAAAGSEWLAEAERRFLNHYEAACNAEECSGLASEIPRDWSIVDNYCRLGTSLRAVRQEHASTAAGRARLAARINTLVENLASRGESMQGMRRKMIRLRNGLDGTPLNAVLDLLRHLTLGEESWDRLKGEVERAARTSPDGLIRQVLNGEVCEDSYTAAEMVEVTDGIKVYGHIARVHPLPQQPAMEVRQAQLNAGLAAIEAWRAKAEVEEADTDLATRLSYCANPLERELWQDSSPYSAGRTFTRERCDSQLGTNPYAVAWPQLEGHPSGARCNTSEPAGD